MNVLVGIPAYNVADTLADVVARVRRAAPEARVLVVDDGSADATLAVANEVADEVVQHPVNRGYGGTQKSIARHFLESDSYGPDDCLLYIHGDGEMRPEEIPSVLAPLADPAVEVTLGSRDLGLARRHGFVNVGLIRPPWKRAIDRGMTTVLNTVYGVGLTTYAGGFRAIRKPALQKLDLESLHDRHFFDIQFLTWAGKRLRYVEVPISNVDNGAISNYSLAQAATHVAGHAIQALLRPGHVTGDRDTRP